MFLLFSIMNVSAKEELEQCAVETRIIEDAYVFLNVVIVRPVVLPN